MNTYEAMMLFDPAFASEQDNIRKEVDRLLERAGAQLIAMHRWDERKLAYEIKKRKRGVYVLVYMRAPAQSIAPLERDVGLSEGVLRALILRADHVTEEKMQIAPPPPGEGTRRGEWGENRGRREGGYRGRSDRGDRGDRSDRGDRRHDESRRDKPPSTDKTEKAPTPEPASVGADSGAVSKTDGGADSGADSKAD